MSNHPVTWWCSFVDPERPDGQRFLGVVLVEMEPGALPPLVAATLWAKNLNPGGEMLAYAWSEFPVPEKFRNRLLTAEQAGEADRWMALHYAENAVPTSDDLRAMGTVAGEGEQ